MAMTRGMTAKQNQTASNRKRLKTLDDNGCSAPLLHLLPEILLSIILRLGVTDFIAFSGVCKSLRTFALANRNMFMLSRKPMVICVSTQVAKRKECCLVDSEGRKFTTILPRSSGRTYVGIASGYLILFGRKTRDFRLVNLITRHELYFPSCPFLVVTDPEVFRGILVFSQTMSRWVFVISSMFSKTVSYSLSGNQASWTQLFSETPICDLQFFQGKIYTLDSDLHLFEVRLDPEPTLTLLKMKNSVVSHIILPKFTTSGGRLFVTGYLSGRYRSVELDFDQLKWSSLSALKEYPCFVSILRCGIYKVEYWEEPRTLYASFGYFHGTVKNKKNHARATTSMWYFPSKCLDVNRLHE